MTLWESSSSIYLTRSDSFETAFILLLMIAPRASATLHGTKTGVMNHPTFLYSTGLWWKLHMADAFDFF